MIKEIILAPMEGVLDYPLRQVITAQNKYDYAVSEFIRISDVVFPSRIFYQEVPELKTAGCTKNGTPVWVQLLGSDPKLMADNALAVAKLGAPGIDLNFGCPSKFVHRSNGGAAMLKTPKLLGEVIKQVRDAVPHNIPVSAKVRLGWEDVTEFPEIFNQCIQNGADKIIVHARTKADGYKAGTINWQAVADFAKDAKVPVVINGDIFDNISAQKSMNQSKCDSIMLGRFAIAIPNLERVLRVNDKPNSAIEVIDIALSFVEIMGIVSNEHYQKARLKQFLGYVRLAYPELKPIFRKICRSEAIDEMINILNIGKQAFSDGVIPFEEEYIKEQAEIAQKIKAKQEQLENQ